jgi:hypothetical protein
MKYLGENIILFVKNFKFLDKNSKYNSKLTIIFEKNFILFVKINFQTRLFSFSIFLMNIYI